MKLNFNSRSKLHLITAAASSLLAVIIMGLIPPASVAVLAIWFLLVGAGAFSVLQLVGVILTENWSSVQSLIYAVAFLSLVALSSLGQLTMIDLLVVSVLSLLAQFIYRIQSN